MSQLRVTCFQTFEVVIGEKVVTKFRSVKGRALLAYLAVEQGHPLRREALAGLLWPDETEARARRNLSQTLLELRQAIQDRSATPPYLQISHHTIALNPASDHWIDVAAFRTGLTTTTTHAHDRLESCADCMAQLQQAAALYHGPFLDGFYVDESDLFETWILTQRERLQQHALEALTTLSRYYEGLDDYDSAQSIVRRRLTLAPWQEEAHQQLMRLLALNGERTLALAQYDTCCQALDDELGVLPSAATTALYDQILAGKIGRVEPPPTIAPAPASPAPFQALAPPPHFVGRDKVLEQLHQGLRQPGLQIYALVGMGGVGKTTLANTLVRHMLDQAAFYDIGWVSAKQEESLASQGIQSTGRPALDIDTLTDTLLDQLEDQPLLAASAKQKRAGLTARLKAQPYLIVVDNLETGNQFEEARACSNLGFLYIGGGHWWRSKILCCLSDQATAYSINEY